MHKVNFEILRRELAGLGFESLSNEYLTSENLSVYSTGVRLICEGKGIVSLELDLESLTNERVLRLVKFLLEGQEHV